MDPENSKITTQAVYCSIARAHHLQDALNKRKDTQTQHKLGSMHGCMAGKTWSKQQNMITKTTEALHLLLSHRWEWIAIVTKHLTHGQQSNGGSFIKIIFWCTWINTFLCTEMRATSCSIRSNPPTHTHPSSTPNQAQTQTQTHTSTHTHTNTHIPGSVTYTST